MEEDERRERTKRESLGRPPVEEPEAATPAVAVKKKKELGGEKNQRLSHPRERRRSREAQGLRRPGAGAAQDKDLDAAPNLLPLPCAAHFCLTVASRKAG